MQQRSLIVQAQSSESLHEIGKTTVSPDAPGKPILSLSLRAFQSGRVLYRPLVSIEDPTIAYREKEGAIKSAIAIPIAGKDGLSIAVLYLVSDEAEAFDAVYQRILRLIGLMIEELLGISYALHQKEERISDVVSQPHVVNKTLGVFLSENDFVKDVEDILCNVKENSSPSLDGTTSFISIDVDDLSKLTNKYGDHVLVNLSKALGNRIEEQIGILFDRPKDCKIYYIFADRFYVLLKNVSLDQARENADKLRQALKNGNYVVSVMPTSVDQLRTRVELEPITVRLGVSSYEHTKFLKLLNERSLETCITDVVAGSVLYYLDVELNRAKQLGGDCIVSYHLPEPPKFEHGRIDLWSPPEA